MDGDREKIRVVRDLEAERGARWGPFYAIVRFLDSILRRLLPARLGNYTPTPLTEGQASAMTVNERLFASGLMDAFDRALAAGDEGEMTRVLEMVYLTPDDVCTIVEHCRKERIASQAPQ